MHVMGLQGSPRKRGNTESLISAFLDEAKTHGAHCQLLDVPRMNIRPCQGCGNCEKKGFCVIDDDMQQVYPLLRQADIIVMGTPVYFYGATAQLKALIDRSQALWSRKYVHRLDDPGRKWRLGYFLSVGATKGKDLFEGITLTAKYFFDAVGAHFKGSLTYRQIEQPGDINKHSSAISDTRDTAQSMTTTFLHRKNILFLCTENAGRSQMAGAFARFYAGNRIKALTAGSRPANQINPVVVEAMEEKGIDMAYLSPKSIEEAVQEDIPDLIVTMGCEDQCPMYPGAKTVTWDLPDPGKQPLPVVRKVRDEIEHRIRELIASDI